MINDTINPMSFDITKNLHGHVRVETRDRWTGRVVDSQEKDNLVTNAVLQMIYSSVWASNTEGAAGSLWTPIFSKALGGLFLFDGTLTESADNIDLPSNAKLIAYAGQTSNAGDPARGSYNSAESVYTANGFTTVWDYTTSQANGTIAALARTSHLFSSFPLAYQAQGYTLNYKEGSSDAISPIWLGYDSTNHYLYAGTYTNATIDGAVYSNANIYRIRQDLTKITLLNVMPPAAQMELVKTLTSSDGSARCYDWAYDKYANNFVYITGTTIHLVSMDGTHTTKTATGTSGDKFAVTENYYWRASGSTIYRITKSNTSDVASFASPITASTLCPDACENDIVYVHGAGSSSAKESSIVYPDGDTVDMGSTAAASYSSYSQRQVGQFYSGGGSENVWRPRTNYLGTIANLDSPVTKTSSQTMKITYTLTEA